MIVIHLECWDRWGEVAWRTKPSALNHAALWSAKFELWELFYSSISSFLETSIEKLKIRTLKEIINKCDWNWYSNCQYWIIYSCFKSGNKVIFSQHEIWKILSVKSHDIYSCSGSLIWSKPILCVGFAVFYSGWIDWKFYVEGKAVALKTS